MSPVTLGMWQAMHEIDPFDSNRLDRGLGEVAAAAMLAGGVKKMDGSYFVPSDFMVYREAQLDPDIAAAERDRLVAIRVRQALLAASGHKAKED